MTFLGQARDLFSYTYKYAIEKGITWYLNSPGFPHFGGLWETALKPTKYHMKRTCGWEHESDVRGDGYCSNIDRSCLKLTSFISFVM